MRHLYDLVDWKLETVLPEFANNPKFEEIIKELSNETEAQDAQFKALREPVYDLNMGGIVVVTGLPIVDKEKSVKLRALFETKLIPSAGLVASDLEDFQFEWASEGGLSTGTAILRFKDEEKAKRVAERLNGVLLPPKFTLTVLTLAEFEDMKESLKNKTDIPVISHSSLIDRFSSADSFEKVSFAISNPRRPVIDLWNYDYYDRTLAVDKSVECSFVPSDVSFSDSGNFLVAILGNHFEMYGGSDFQLLRKFAHKHVSKVKISKNDKYAISYNGPADVKFGSDNIIVWNLLTGEKIRSFQAPTALTFDTFQFSDSENFICGVVKSATDGIDLAAVYELPSCQLLLDPSDSEGKRRTPLPVEGVMSVCWAPKRDALFVAGSKAGKSDLAIWEVPARKRIPWMAVPYEITTINAKWGENEKSLLVSFVAQNRKKAENIVQLATLDWMKRQCYVSMLSLEGTTEKSEFVVSPNGLSFAVLTPQKVGLNFHFYLISEKNKSAVASPLYQLNHQTMKYVSFSPFSNFLVVYNEQKIWFAEIKSIGGKSEFKLIREAEQRTRPNSAIWTPCGRFVSFASRNNELLNLTIFDSIGRQVLSQDLRDVKSLVVRPSNFAYMSVLSKDQREKIAAQVAKLSQEATKEDKRIRNERKHLANLKQTHGFEKLQKYLLEKWRIWEETKSALKERLGEQSLEQVVIVRVDKTETLDEIEDKQ